MIDVEYRNQNDDLVGVESWTGFGYRREALMTTATKPLTIDEVSVGDELPPSFGYDVTATTVVVGALATRDWRPQHHDFHFATERNGVKDIFINRRTRLAWFERYLTDWSGPTGRLGRMGFRMIDSIFPGDTMVFTATVTSVGPTKPAAAGSGSTCR